MAIWILHQPIHWRFIRTRLSFPHPIQGPTSRNRRHSSVAKYRLDWIYAISWYHDCPNIGHQFRWPYLRLGFRSHYCPIRRIRSLASSLHCPAGLCALGRATSVSSCDDEEGERACHLFQ